MSSSVLDSPFQGWQMWVKFRRGKKDQGRCCTRPEGPSQESPGGKGGTV